MPNSVSLFPSSVQCSDALSYSVTQVKASQVDYEFVSFLEELAHWDPSQDPLDSRTELMRTLMLACKKHPIRNEIVGGSKVDQAVNAIWAAMVYHTPGLHHGLRTYGNASVYTVYQKSKVKNYMPGICSIDGAHSLFSLIFVEFGWLIVLHDPVCLYIIPSNTSLPLLYE